MLRIAFVVVAGIGLVGACKKPAPAGDKVMVTPADAVVTPADAAPAIISVDAPAPIDATTSTTLPPTPTTWTVTKAGSKCHSQRDGGEAPPTAEVKCPAELGDKFQPLTVTLDPSTGTCTYVFRCEPGAECAKQQPRPIACPP